ncbi:MAG: DNA modification methylase [Chloroflexi bacterium]|nr:DNA modification methylase [Chloroflexota bacterium]
MSAKAAPVAPPAWRNRIVGSGEVAPDQLLANPANWRVHPAAQRNALRGSLSEVGWVAQVMVNQRTGYVVDGHARIEEALSRGETSVPVLYVDLSPEEEALVLATLDPIGAMAEQSTERLEALLADITVDDAGLEALLASMRPPRAGLVDPDDVPDVPEESFVRPGELWALGDHRLLCGDATNAEDVARLLDGATPTLLATDPPYGVSLDQTWRDGVYNGPQKRVRGWDVTQGAERPYMVVGRKMRGDGKAGARTAGHRNITISGDVRADWSAAFALVPSLQVGYIWYASAHTLEVLAGLLDIGFELVAQIIWDKGLFSIGRSWYHWAHEPCFVVRRPGLPNLFIGERNQATIWRAPSPKRLGSGSTEEKQDHPAQKPVVLSETPIRNHLAPGGLVYDPFLGSGTTLIAAERLGRRCYGLEVEPRYCQVIIERWQNFTGRPAEKIDG